MATASATTASGTEAGRTQPQTSVEPGGGPFIRHAQAGRQPIYVDSARAFAGQLTQPLIARPGYYRNFRVTHANSAGTTTTAAFTADGPYNLSTFLQVKDAFGTPVFTGDGYSITNLVPMFSGGFGLLEGTNLAANLPSWSGVAASTGAFSYSYALPFEFAQGYGVIAGANASVVPTLQFNFAAAATVLSGTLTSIGSITTTVDTDIYWLPEGVDVEPPGLGTTRQWQVAAGNPTIAASGSLRVQATRLGGYLDTVIIVMRDSTNARITEATTTLGWPSGRMQIILDGIPYIDSTMNELFDDMAIQYGVGTAGLATSTRPTGVLALCRKTSLAQRSLGLLDTGEKYLSTNPGSLLEFYGSPWGTLANSPATLQVICGQIVPTGAIIQGLPET